MRALAFVFAATAVAIVAQRPVQPAASAISGSGLLPVYGVDLTIDHGADDALAKAFAPLAPLGVGAVRFGVDVRDGAAPGRVAQLCVWAAEKGVKLVPVLTGAKEGEAVGPAFAAQSAGFVTALFQTLGGMQPSRADAYQQILAFQIERAM